MNLQTMVFVFLIIGIQWHCSVILTCTLFLLREEDGGEEKRLLNVCFMEHWNKLCSEGHAELSTTKVQHDRPQPSVGCVCLCLAPEVPFLVEFHTECPLRRSLGLLLPLWWFLLRSNKSKTGELRGRDMCKFYVKEYSLEETKLQMCSFVIMMLICLVKSSLLVW